MWIGFYSVDDCCLFVRFSDFVKIIIHNLKKLKKKMRLEPWKGDEPCTKLQNRSHFRKVIYILQ